MQIQPRHFALPISREGFTEQFGVRPVFGMVHLAPLPGSPLFRGSIDEVLTLAMADARAIEKGGATGMIFENFGDRPFQKTVGAETVAAMTFIIATVTREVSSIPFGVNVLRNDGESAMAIAGATGAAFIRVNVLTGAVVTDQGLIEGSAGEVLRKRAALQLQTLIFADHNVKHAEPIAEVDAIQSALDLRLRGLADAIIVTGKATGAAADLDNLRRLRERVDAPLLVGSGLSEENAREFSAVADGAIVGTSIKRNGSVSEPMDTERVARIVAAFSKASR